MSSLSLPFPLSQPIERRIIKSSNPQRSPRRRPEVIYPETSYASGRQPRLSILLAADFASQANLRPPRRIRAEARTI